MTTESPRLPYGDTPVLKGNTWYSYGPRVEEDGVVRPVADEDGPVFWSVFVFYGDHWHCLGDFETKEKALSFLQVQTL